MPYPGNLPLVQDSGVIGPNANRQGPNQADAIYIDAAGTAVVSTLTGLQVANNGHLTAGQAPGAVGPAVTSPTAAAGANAGTGPPAPVVTANSTDVAGSITFGTGTTPAAGAQVVVTFAQAFGAAPLGVVITPINNASAALQLNVSATAVGTFTVGCNTAPAGSQANTIYGFRYIVVGQS